MKKLVRWGLLVLVGACALVSAMSRPADAEIVQWYKNGSPVAATTANPLPVQGMVSGTSGNGLPIAMAQQLDKTNDSIAIGYRSKNYLTFTAAQIGGATSDTLISSLTKNAAGTTTGSIGSYTITNLKTFRITSICFTVRAGAAAAVNTVFNLRNNTAGATIATSALVGTWDIAAPSNLSGDGSELCAAIPDGGLEFVGDGTNSIGWSHLSSATTNVESITVLGYEFTAP